MFYSDFTSPPWFWGPATLDLVIEKSDFLGFKLQWAQWRGQWVDFGVFSAHIKRWMWPSSIGEVLHFRFKLNKYLVQDSIYSVSICSYFGWVWQIQKQIQITSDDETSRLFYFMLLLRQNYGPNTLRLIPYREVFGVEDNLSRFAANPTRHACQAQFALSKETKYLQKCNTFVWFSIV